MQKRLMLVCEDSLCPRKATTYKWAQPHGGEVGRYIMVLEPTLTV